MSKDVPSTGDLAADQTNRFLIKLMRQISQDGRTCEPNKLGQALSDELNRLGIHKGPHDQRLDGLMEHLLKPGALLDPRNWNFDQLRQPGVTNEDFGEAFADQMQNVLRLTLMMLALYERMQTEAN